VKHSLPKRSPEAADRFTLAALIAERLTCAAAESRAQWHDGSIVRSAVIDDLLPAELAGRIGAAFPELDRMMFKSSIRERKHVAAQMDQHDPILEEAVFAFQDPRVLSAVAGITALEEMEPDSSLYAGGISAMGQGAYLRPHLDNSHDAARKRYRVLNLLYYVSPGWEEADGGCLQLWDEGPTGPSRTIASHFNRLVLMATDRHSWHSVNEVRAPRIRRCVSNYYFSQQPPEAQPYFHATSFRSEHGKGLADLAMRFDNRLRTTVLKLTGEKLYRNPHHYRRVDD